MNNGALLSVSMSASLGANVFRKYYTKKNPSGLSQMLLFNGIGGIVSALVFFIWGGFGDISLFTFFLGIVFGLITTVQVVSTLLALQTGPMSFTTIIVSFSSLITAFSGVLFWHETLRWLQIVGIALMVCSFFFAIEKKEDEKKASGKWLTLCLVALVGRGLVGVMQKTHQTSAYKGEINAFLIVAFLVSSLVSWILIFVFSKKEKVEILPKTEKNTLNWLLLAVIVLTGVFVAVNNKLNLYLSGVMDSAVFFPIVEGGGLVLTALAALVIFKEKPTKKQWIGIVIGMLSVLCFCLKF